jgi:uncharacterized protein (TIGR02145 family)
MKNIRLILVIFLLLAFVPYAKGQETHLMMMHKNGSIRYTSNLTTSDTIAFSQEEIKTLKHIQNGNVVEIPTSDIDSITFHKYTMADWVTIAMSDAIDISVNGATFNASVAANVPITGKGIRYSSQHSTLSFLDSGWVFTGGTGAYSATFYDLKENTTYYVCPYAVASNGYIHWGEVKRFTTSQCEGVMIGGVCWATHNVDMPGTFTANPEDAGMLYRWNSTIGWSSTDPMVNSIGGTTWDPPGSVVGTYIDVRWERVNNPCPKGWRMPIQEELFSLGQFFWLNQWTTLNGVTGRTFNGEQSSIFLPAAGYRDDNTGACNDVGTVGYYWTTSTYCYVNPSAYYLYFSSVHSYPGNTNHHADGFSIRCVQGVIHPFLE